MIKAVIIDDEESARDVLHTLLMDYCPDVKVLDKVCDVPKGVISINKHKPDVVFLDVEMPQYSGFELLDFFNEIDFEIIFVTAYSEYAIQAFQISAIDYLLKPLQIDKLENAVLKLNDKIQTSTSGDRINNLKKNLEQQNFEKIALPTSEGYEFIQVKNISYLEADGSYTHVYFRNDNKKIVVSKRLKFFEELLYQFPLFFRNHRSYIVNLEGIERYNRSENFLKLENEKSIPLARDNKQAFEAKISPFSL